MMKWSVAAAVALLASANAAPTATKTRRTVQGFDISHYQGTVDFSAAKASGAAFVFIKATESSNNVDPDFSSHYEGATQAGLLRSGYHFADPGASSGAQQATFFYQNGGGWSDDGQTLPGMLDLEDGTSTEGSYCYGLSESAMVSWISDWVDTYQSSTGVYPIIYTSNDWWNTCTGNSDAFSSTCPLNIADYNSSPGTIPGGWGYETFWQYNDSYQYGGDSDLFNGALSSLDTLAKNG